MAEAASRERFARCVEESARLLDLLRSGENVPDAVLPAGTEPRPLRVAISHRQRGDLAEAAWLGFLVTHLGWDRPASSLAVYRAGGESSRWTWREVSRDGGEEMARWVASNAEWLHVAAPFGNHRKYQSHRPTAPTGTPAVVRSFVPWLREHQSRLASAGFGDLYRSLDRVAGMGRTARYDYLRLLGLLGIAPLEADACYFAGASGPRAGAARMFGKGLRPAELEAGAKRLASHLGVELQAVEDALCQWQKRKNGG
ncbi:MAG: hypothetical protein AB7T37_06880 [Dehalococcoidia bacterium]